MTNELPALTAREVIRAFQAAGYEQVRQSGSHVILKREGARMTLSVPNHGHKEVSRGVLRRLISASGMTMEEFNSLSDSVN